MSASWDNNPLLPSSSENYQIIADLTLPTPYKANCRIDVDGALLVAPL